MKTCAIWTIDTQTLQTYLDESSTLKQVIVEKLGMKMQVSQGMHYKRLKKRIKQDNLDTTKFDQNHKAYMKNKVGSLSNSKKKDDSECFKQDSNHSRCGIKRRILASKTIPHECALCKTGPLWNGQELALELDHINQINNDNRIENLRFLCPNCHSQVTNAHRKNNKKSVKDILTNTCNCGNVKWKKSYRCRKCSSKNNAMIARNFTRRFDPSKEELEFQLQQHTYNMRATGRHYGVSDNAVRKRCRLLGVSWKV